jgi:hypothetical protein
MLIAPGLLTLAMGIGPIAKSYQALFEPASGKLELCNNDALGDGVR